MFDSIIQQSRQVVTCGLSRGELEGLVAGAGRAIAALSALQTRCATEIETLDDGGVNSKTVLREAGRMSTRAANTVAKTAAGLAEMPKLAESLAEGKISVEHASVAVGAAAKTSAQQVDDELSRFAETSSVDVFAEQSRRWVNRNQPDDGADAHEARHRHRLFKHWINDEGMGVLLAELDPTSYQQVVKAFNVEYDRLWRDDGGRDGKPDEIRTPGQRMADALVALLTNPARRGPGSTRMQLIAVADIARLRADNPTGIAEIVGGEALPQTVLERLACTAAVTGVVFDGEGQPIWVGRTLRHATEAQIKAIIARDRHCRGSGCAAGPERCEIHHIVPWEQGGLTDIDSMCLACPTAITTSTTAATSSSKPTPATKSSTPTTHQEAPKQPGLPPANETGQPSVQPHRALFHREPSQIRCR